MRDGTRPRAPERISEAARALFVERGYTATTIEAIAKEAGVGISTVYAVYGNKREILADAKLEKIFGKKKASMFEMNKHLSAHLKPVA